jgi:hypothetical protein
MKKKIKVERKAKTGGKNRKGHRNKNEQMKERR